MIYGWHVFQTVCIFCLVLSSAVLLGVGRRGGLLTHGYPDVSNMVGICPVWVYLFLQDEFPTPWNFGKNWVLFSGLGGNPFNCLCPAFSGGVSKVFNKFPNCLCVNWIVFSPDLLGGVLYCIRVVDSLATCLVALLWALFCPSVRCNDRWSKFLS